MKINLPTQIEKIDTYFSPKIIAEMNNEYIKIVKIKGEKVPWHNHKDSDELFYILEGSLQMLLEDEKAITMNKGDLFVVKKGENHRVSSEKECHIMLIEYKDTTHTGNVVAEITKSLDQQTFKK